MQVQAIGISQASGISKQSGKPYMMTRLLIIQPFENFSNKPSDYTAEDKLNGRPYYEIKGAGGQLQELEVDNDSYEDFARLQYPAKLELSTDNVIRSNRMQSIINGFTLVEKKVA